MFRSQYPAQDKPKYATRYVYADTQLSTHGGNVGRVSITSEEHARLQQMQSSWNDAATISTPPATR